MSHLNKRNDFVIRRDKEPEMNKISFIHYSENKLLLEIMAETSSERLRPPGSTGQTVTEDSDNRDFTNTGPFEQCMASSEKPEYQRRTDRPTGQRAKESKHKWNGFFWEREGSDEIWKTKRIEFQGDAAYRIRTNFGYLELGSQR